MNVIHSLSKNRKSNRQCGEKETVLIQYVEFRNGHGGFKVAADLDSAALARNHASSSYGPQLQTNTEDTVHITIQFINYKDHGAELKISGINETRRRQNYVHSAEPRTFMANARRICKAIRQDWDRTTWSRPLASAF